MNGSKHSARQRQVTTRKSRQAGTSESGLDSRRRNSFSTEPLWVCPDLFMPTLVFSMWLNGRCSGCSIIERLNKGPEQIICVVDENLLQALSSFWYKFCVQWSVCCVLGPKYCPKSQKISTQKVKKGRFKSFGYYVLCHECEWHLIKGFLMISVTAEGFFGKVYVRFVCVVGYSPGFQVAELESWFYGWGQGVGWKSVPVILFTNISWTKTVQVAKRIGCKQFPYLCC